MSNIPTDLVARLEDLHKQAITERSHFYVASCCVEAIIEITRLRQEVADKESDCARLHSALMDAKYPQTKHVDVGAKHE